MRTHKDKPGRTDRRSRATGWLLIFLAGSLLPAGCGGLDYELAPVSGRITLHGKPLADVLVNFQPNQEGNPEPGPGSFARTDADGCYSLKTIAEPPTEGAVVGPHVVTLTAYDAKSLETDEATAPAVMLPVQAVDGSLSFEVPAEGTDQANFDL